MLTSYCIPFADHKESDLLICLSRIQESTQHERIKHINFVMNEIHNSNNNIYELLIDQQYKELRVEVVNNIRMLRSILENIEDEI